MCSTDFNKIKFCRYDRHWKTSPSSPPKITRCNDGRCKTCKFIGHNTTSYTFHNTGQTRTIHRNLSCSSDNLIYMINCKRCLKTDTTLPSQYIGQTGRTLRERFREHRRGIQNNTDESVPIHFILPHHTLNAPKIKSEIAETVIVTPWKNILFLLLER